MTANSAPASRSATHEIRLARAEDEPSITQLLPELDGPSYSERFPGKTCADFIRWKYLANPAGEAAVGVALEGDRVVSIVAGTPKRVRLNGEVVTAFELGDFITAADHRKRGLFSALIELVCESARQRGAAVVYVRPNDVSFPILASRLGFFEPRQIEMRRYAVPSGVAERKLGKPGSVVRGLGVDAMLRGWALPKPSKSLSIGLVERFDDAMDQLWARAQDRYRFSLVRDSRYLNWRYVDCPTPYRVWIARRSGALAGYLVAGITHKQPVGTILDLFTSPDDEEAAGTLLHAAVEAMLGAGIQIVYTWTLQTGAESAASRMLKRACMLVQKPLLHFAMRPLQGQDMMRELPASGWQLALGDFDGA